MTKDEDTLPEGTIPGCHSYTADFSGVGMDATQEREKTRTRARKTTANLNAAFRTEEHVKKSKGERTTGVSGAHCTVAQPLTTQRGLPHGEATLRREWERRYLAVVLSTPWQWKPQDSPTAAITLRATPLRRFTGG